MVEAFLALESMMSIAALVGFARFRDLSGCFFRFLSCCRPLNFKVATRLLLLDKVDDITQITLISDLTLSNKRFDCST